jgi:hypothetical protein
MRPGTRKKLNLILKDYSNRSSDMYVTMVTKTEAVTCTSL